MAQKPKLGSGKRFKSLADKVAREYEKKGVPPAEAKRIGNGAAANAGRKAHGNKQMSEMAAKGRKRSK